MNWSSDPPRISGWWFVGVKVRGKNAIRVELVEVRELKRKWQWRFSDVPVWHFLDEFPDYKWAGPITSPSLENFNKAKQQHK